jgi:hypothetical protein
MPTGPAETPPLRDDAALERWLFDLLLGATHPQLWLFFLDEDDRPTGPVMPCDELPDHPDELATTDDLGTLPVTELFAHRFANLMREFDFAQVVVVWERCGGDRITDLDRAWARLGDHLVRHGVRVRARYLLHEDGMRIFTPDDLPTAA